MRKDFGKAIPVLGILVLATSAFTEGTNFWTRLQNFRDATVL